nr:MAG TPA: repressor protein [Caudoviricetes sp.]
MKNPQNLAETIEALSKEKGISVSSMLQDLEMNKNALFTMKKSGYLPRVESLCKFADYFQCSLDYLLGRTDNPNPSNNVTLSSDQNRLLQMYSLLSDMEKGEILGELKAMTANKRPIQTIRAVARSVDNRPPRLITGDFSDILDAPDISDKY